MAAPGAGASRLHGRYLVQNPIWNAWLRGADAILDRLASSGESAVPINPQRFLLAIGGHLGDALLATSVLEPLLTKWPDLEIGVATGAWNVPVFQHDARIKRIHIVDHWKLDRSGTHLLRRFTRTASTWQKATREISSVGYDVAVDLYPYYPNASLLLRRAGVPVRMGYTSGGGGAHYTHRLDWVPGRHMADDYARLLREVGVDAELRSYSLPPIDGDALQSARMKLKARNVDSYVVFHMGAGSPAKLWPTKAWSVVGRAVPDRFNIVLTGAGVLDKRIAAAFCSGEPGAIDMVEELTWNEFRAVLASARAVLSVDTAAAHLSAAVGAPTFVLMTGSDDPRRWRPLGNNVTVLQDHAPERVAATFLRELA